MSEVVENVSELQNSAPSNEAAQSTEAINKEVTNNVEIAEEAVPDEIKAAPKAPTETGEGSSQKPATEESSSTSPKIDNKKTPVKRTRMSFIERAQKESEELVRTLGGSLEMEGGRRTRSSTRGTPTRSAVVSTPPPTKKSRASPASGASTPTRPRGRGRKIDTTTDGSAEEESSPTTTRKKTPAKGKKTAAKESLEDHQVDEKKFVEETEKKSDDNKSADNSTKEDNVDSVTAAEVVSAEIKSIEALDHTESNKDHTEGKKEVETENEIVKEELKNEDKTDAVLEPVVEETQSQVALETITAEENIAKEPESVSHVEKVIAESEKPDSAMETEDAKPEGSEEKLKHNADNTSAIKEPTPEPMDVDSSSKSNEALEKMDDDVSDVVETSAPTEENVVQTPKEVESNNLTVEAEPSSVNASNLNDVITVEDNVQQNSVVTDGVATPANEDAENNTLVAKLINEPPVVAATNVAVEQSTEESTPAAHNDLNKTENDLCEPKIATSPPISAANDNNGTVTTPQTCN